MKKRIFMLALVVGVMLSVCGSAWAETYFFRLGDVSTSGNIYEAEQGQSVTVSFDVVVAVTRQDSETGDTYTDSNSNLFYKNANVLKWTVEAESFSPTAMTIQKYNDGSVIALNENLLDNPGYAMSTSGFSMNNGSSGTYHYVVTITGTLSGTENSIAIKVSLYSGSDNSSPVTTYASDTTLASTAVAETDEETITTTSEADSDTHDAADPDSVSSWNGLDPTFSNTINKTSYDIGKNKPKLGKIDKANLTFTPGTAKDLTVPMLGPIELVDVYIAQKDAKKLYPASADSITADIRLTSASIKAYKIPFRVTSYDFAKTVTATGDDETKLKKAQAKAWKSAENSLTLSFNGSKMQYKGFPLTIEMSNSNNTSKPTKKAIKLNIGSDFTTPAWTYEVTSTDKTTDEATYEAWTVGEDGTYYKGIVYTDEYEATSEIALTAEAATAAGLDATGLTDGAVVTGSSDGNKYIYTNGSFYPAALKVDYYYRRFTYNKMIDKKDKLEASTWVNDSAAGTADDPKTGEIERIYYASADAPYAITLKPDLTKDTAKITKFFTSAASIDVVQPVYDYLGNVKTHGYVKIQGVPKETSKESKLAFTLTATNPSTKKKGAAKVTANAKTFPEIQKTNNVTISATELENWDYDTNYEPTYYGDAADDGSITYKRVSVKKVEAGKVPSVKVKAKGSKTISYKLGKYTVDDDGNVDETDYEDFNATMLANLKALKLSFDEKKGAVVLLDKNDKATKPTLNSDEDAFQSLDIVITAVNNVGYDQAWAHVAITGAKPKMADKSVTVEGTKQTGDTITFKVLAGKDAAEGKTDGSANVKVYAADSTAAKTLSDYGLALVPYDSMDVIVSAEVTVTAGTILPASFNEETDLVEGSVRDADTSTEGSTEISGRKYAGTDGATILSGDTWAKSANLSLKNYGILQVIDPSALAKVSKDKTANKGVSVNLTLENLGATNKGKLKVIIKDTVDGGDPLDPVVTTTTSDSDSSSSESSESSTESGAAPKTNGTASLTYNGALPEDAEEAAKGTVTFGEPRTVADLTAGQQAFLAEKGYTVVAVLPEITADVSDQYKLEDIELDEEAPEGATLIWIAFPKNAPASEDDEIVDFYDEAGTPVEGVPASHKIIASPWLREAVTYEPVIAIEAK